MHVVLVNRSVGSLSIYPVSGKSGKLYGQAMLRPELRGPAFKMSLEEYEKATDDLIGNTFPGQQWIPLFVEDAPQPDNQPPLEQPMPSHFTHLGLHFELTDYGLMAGDTRMTIDVLRAFSSKIDPRVWFRLIKREDAVLTVESKIIEDQPPVDPKKSVRALLAMFAVNDLRSLAKKLQVDTQGSRDILIEAISEKVSTE